METNDVKPNTKLRSMITQVNSNEDNQPEKRQNIHTR